MPSRLTHFALHVSDIERSARFYQDFAGMNVVRSWANQDRSWANQDGGGLKVKWLKTADAAGAFVLVLLEGESQFPGAAFQAPIGPLSHFGFDLGSRAEIDDVARAGAQAGILLMAPRDAGEIVGYHCYLRDPDGHSVEFSYGQALD